MNNYCKFFFLAILLLCFSVTTSFAGSGPGGEGSVEDNPDGVETPIDGGLSLLVGTGIAYYAKRAYSRRKKLEK